jgi:hypothetical protein
MIDEVRLKTIATTPTRKYDKLKRAVNRGRSPEIM